SIESVAACMNMPSRTLLFFFSSRRRHTRFSRDWSSDVCSSDLPLFTMNMINNFSSTGFTWTAVTAVDLILVIQAVLSGLTYFLMRMLGERIVANLRNTLWQHILHLKTPYFDAHESGETMSRITQDTSVVKE